MGRSKDGGCRIEFFIERTAHDLKVVIGACALGRGAPESQLINHSRKTSWRIEKSRKIGDIEIRDGQKPINWGEWPGF
jgi:hypothetical protein